jgi:peptidoglycan/xylan/chitin deacetylase (PgdA/CDA1 family)
MMLARRLFFYFFVVFSLISIALTQTQTSPAKSPSPKIAITFDDLPAHSALPPGETRLDVAQKIIAAFREAKMPPVYGFVNGSLLAKETDGMAVLEAWAKSGNPLGNHTWSHMNLAQNTVEKFEEDIKRNEPLLSKVSAGHDWRWFRYPYLSEGETPEKRAAIRKFLGQRGYKIAGVTMSFHDYLWNEPYARCKAKGDTRAIADLESSYMSAADESISYYRDLSKQLYNRDIPYVLLMHIGALDAEMLPRLLALYRTRGFKFVTLQEAQRDPFYVREMNPLKPAGANSLESAMKEKHMPLPEHETTNPQFDTMCR